MALCLLCAIGVLAVIYLSCSKQVAHGFGLPLDDSWIYAVFARNLAEGKGLVYNPGQPASPTGMLHGLFLGVLYRLAIAPVPIAIASGLLLHLAAAVLVYKAALLLELGETPSAACAMGFAVTPRLMWGALSGMEVSLNVFLVCLGLYWQFRWRWYDGARACLATCVFALATLARPECGAFLAASVLERLIDSARFDAAKGGVARYARTIPLHALVFAALVLPAVVFNIKATGLPLPPAFYAKTGAAPVSSTVALVRQRVVNAGFFVKQGVIACEVDNRFLVPALMLGFVMAWRRASSPARASCILLPLAFVLVPAATGILAHESTGRYQLLVQEGRYSSYLVPIFMLSVGLGLVGLWELLGRRRIWGVVVGVAIVAAATRGFAQGNRCVSLKYGMDVSCVNSMQVKMGRWAATLPEGSILAVNDAGAIAYFSRKRIIDMVGVTNPDIVPYLRRHNSSQEGMFEYLAERKPHYLIIFPGWYGRIACRGDLFHPVKVVALSDFNTVCGGNMMVAYKANWKR